MRLPRCIMQNKANTVNILLINITGALQGAMRTGKLMELKNSRGGGIEGLPLQLMIIILIATMGTAIIVGWMGSIESPHYIGTVEVLTDDIKVTGGQTESGTIEVYVADQDGNPLEGATIVLTGLGIKDSMGETPHMSTDSNGRAKFESLRIYLFSSDLGFVKVNVSKSGYGENNISRVAVIS